MNDPYVQPIDVMKALAKQELAVSALYHKYGELFPNHLSFWSDLEEDEKLHARWLQALFKDVESGEVQFAKDRFNLEALNSMLFYIDEQLQKAKEEKINMTTATSVALDIEKSMIEDSFFEVYEGDHPALKSTLDGLRKATQGHREHVEAMWRRFNKL